MVGANEPPLVQPPGDMNPVQGGGQLGGHGGTGGGNKNTTSLAAKGDVRSKFTGNTTEMKGHVFQPRHVSKNANQYHDTVEVLRQYVAKEYETGRELMALFLPTPVQPAVAEPPDDPTPTGRTTDGALKLTTRDTKTFELSIKRYLEREDQLKDEMHALFYVILGQCDKAITAKLESIDGYATQAAQGNCLWLLQHVRATMNQFDSGQYPYVALYQARRRFYNMSQGKKTVTEYYHAFKTEYDTIGLLHGWPPPDLQLDVGVQPGVEGESDTDAQDAIHQREVATYFLLGADRTRFGKLQRDLQDNYARGTNQFPNTLTAAYNLLLTTDAANNATTDAEALDSSGGPGRRQRGGHRNNIQNGGGHGGNKHSKQANPTGHTGLYTSPCFPPGAILLNTGATSSIIRDRDLLTDISARQPPLTSITNGGPHLCNYGGFFHGLQQPLRVWYAPDSVGNILALCDVRRLCRVTLDTAIEAALLVHLSNNAVLRFIEHGNGLYLLVPSVNPTTKTPSYNYSCMSTVADNRAVFTCREVEGADRARQLYRTIGRPSQRKFEAILDRGSILNCPVTKSDAQRATVIYGPNLAYLKGKTTDHPASPHVATQLLSPLPGYIAKHHSNVTLCFDFFYVQRLPFIHAISRKVGYQQAVAVSDRTKETMLSFVNKSILEYTTRGFEVVDVHADREFECLRESLGNVSLEICGPDEHVPEVERSIRTMKETMRATAHGLPYRRLPKVMITELVAMATRCLNGFPKEDGVSEHMSPHSIVTGRARMDYNKIPLEFGSYVQLLDRSVNTIRSRTIGAIALNPTGDENATYRFMSLKTGQVLTKGPGCWTEVPVTDLAIARVEALAKQEGQPLLQDSNLLVEWRPNQPFDEDDGYDDDYEPSVTDSEDDVELEADDPINEELVDTGEDTQGNGTVRQDPCQEDPPVTEPVPEPITQPELEDVEAGTLVEHEMPSEGEEVPSTEEEGAATMEEEGAAHTEEEGAGQVEEGETTIETDAGDNDLGDNTVQEGRYNLRPNRSREYSHRFDPQVYNVTNAHVPQPTRRLATVDQNVFDFVLTQMTARAGIKKHGQAARDALTAEFAQLDHKGAYEPRHATSLTETQRNSALRIINLIKEKRNGRLKGRSVADGRPQRAFYSKDETSSPTATPESVLLTALIDAVEDRHVVVADVTGAYLNANMDDFVLIRLSGDDVDMMCKANPDYRKFVSKNNGRRTLFLQLKKALYGCVKSALLWYRLFRDTLQDLGFTLNPYDPCVANAHIKGSQCTIVWYVDDNKISHKNQAVVNDLIQRIEAKFGHMTKTEGDNHEFLGMKLQFDRNNKTVKVLMLSYIDEAIQQSCLDVRRAAATPATKSMFDVDPNAAKLSPSEFERFRSVVCKLLYIALRGRPDILLAVVFLASRVAKATLQDQAKLKRLLEYLYGTYDLPLILGADDIQTMYMFIDASYAVHDDMKSHTGRVITFGRGGIACKSAKQKVVTKSSTEAELVGASEYLPSTIWVQYFLQAQGFPHRNSYLEQDNQSAIRLERNGRASASQRSRHINIRYFFVTDRLDTDNITLRYCQTEHMLADFLSKPLQGSLFRKFRDVLLGLAHLSTLRVPTVLPGVERVAGHVDEPVDEPSNNARESRSGLSDNDLGSAVPIRVELDQQ